MSWQEERRRHSRKTLNSHELGLVYPQYPSGERDAVSKKGQDTLLVYLRNISEGGFLLESLQKLEHDTLVDMRMRLPNNQSWQAFNGKIVWANESQTRSGYYLLGVESYKSATHEDSSSCTIEERTKQMQPCDLEFLMNTPLLDAIPLEAKCLMLNAMTPKLIRKGEKIISQGDVGDTFYLIQDGSCIVSVESDGAKHPISRLQAGDVVGEIALLTGEPRTANVEAETDMVLWSLTKGQFDSLCMTHPDCRDFATELVTNRFLSEKVTAERTVGKYIINEIIDRGGWSTVYQGIHSILNLPVAIKMLKHDMAMNPEFSEKFQNEAKIIARLNHENIVKVYDIEELYRTIFIVMEYLEGASLEYILDKAPKMPLTWVLDILLQVCAGLSYAHDQGIVHQDIKPANIFVQTDGKVKILDFGLACCPGTIDFCLPGTVLYMSPEQIEAEMVDERTDIYSLGIMAYELVTGQRPYPEDDLYALMDLHVQEDVPDPRSLVPDLPDELHYVISRATQRDRSKRFKSVWEILRDLQPFADKLGLKRQPHLVQQKKLMSVLLSYQDEHQVIINHLMEDLSDELKKIGAVLQAADFKNV